MAEQTEEKKTFRDVMRVVRRRYLLFIVAAAVGVLATLGAAHKWPQRKYTGRVIFKHEASPTGKQMAGGRNRDFETYKKNLAQRLAGPEAIDYVVVGELKLTKGLPREKNGDLAVRGRAEKQELIQSLTNALRVKIQTETEQLQRVSVSMEYHDANIARELPLALVHNYITQLSEGIMTQLEDSRQYLMARANQAKKDHEDALTEKTNFETKAGGGGGYLPESPQMLSNKITSLERDVADAERNCVETRGKVAMLAVTVFGASATTMPATTMPATTMPATTMPATTMPATTTAATTMPATTMAATTAPAATMPSGPLLAGSTPPAMPPAPGATGERPVVNPEYEALRKKLNDFEERLVAARTLRRMTEKHPSVVKLKERIAQLKEQFAQTPQYLPASAVPEERLSNEELRRRWVSGQQRQIELASARVRLEAMERGLRSKREELKAWQEVVGRSRPMWDEYNRLKVNVTERERQLEDAQVKLENVQEQLSAEVAKKARRLSLIWTDPKQARPSSPTLERILGYAAGIGLALGAAMVFVFNFFDRSIKGAEDVTRHFGVPVVGMIDEITTKRQRRRRKATRWVLGSSTALVALTAAAFLGMSVYLNLHDLKEYGRFWEDPPAYVRENYVDPAWDQVQKHL